MTRKKGKSVSFDAMVKFFMMNYNVATRSDVEKVMVRIDRLEQLVRSMVPLENRANPAVGDTDGFSLKKKPSAMTASESVMEAVKLLPGGSGFAEIQLATGFGEKNCVILYSGSTNKKKSGV